MTEHFLQVCVALMAMLGTLLLGIEQWNALLPLTTAFVAITSVIFTDRLGWFSLHSILANLIAVGAVAYTLLEVAGQPTESQLLSVANLLVYLQIVLFYQRKTVRLYWQLITLSLLQVVVAAALNLVFIFGLLLVVYLFLALAGLSSFYLYRESQRGVAVAGLSPQVTYRGIGQTEGPERFRAATPSDARTEITTGSLLGQAAWLGGWTLVTTMVVFFLLPRQDSMWKKRSLQRQRLVGFTEEVNLDEMGPILESTEMVMRVTFTDPLTETPYRVWGEPYFRGAVLTNYSPGFGVWRRPSFGGFDRPIPQATSLRGLVKQEITLEPGDHSVIFCVPPPLATRETGASMAWQESSLTVVPKDPDKVDNRSKLRMVALTSGFRRGEQQALLYDPLPEQQRPPPDFAECRRFPAAELTGLKDLADEILTMANASSENVISTVRALEAHFLTARRYTYSLDSKAQRDRSLDPIEDFVMNHRTGHCEFFASALALMLRSQNIPARLVIGYKGGEYNSVGNYFQIRQLHAHAWVECYLSREQLAAMNLDASAPPSGGWLRLDPTPSTVDPLQGLRQSGWVNRLAHFSDHAQLLWNDYVLGLDSQRQRESIYRPLFDGARATFDNLLSRVAWEQRWAALMTRLGISPEVARGPINSWIRIAVGLILSLALVAFLLRRQLGGLLQRLSRGTWKRIRGHRQPDDIYWQLEQFLAQFGWRRLPSQTPREWIVPLTQQLATSRYRELPAAIVDALYRVRFGGGSLDTVELQQLQHDLAAWEREQTGKQAL